MKVFKKKDFDFVNECLKDKFDISLKEQEQQKKIMKDEIKEILDNKLYFDLEEEDYIKIKDYIINLQTIEQQYSAILSENVELENKITNLQEENEKLKQWDCNKDSRNSRQRVELKKLIKENERLKEDKKKVLDLIENDYFEDGSFKNYYKVRNILNGGDEEI